MLIPYESHRTRHGPRLRLARRRSVVALTSGRLAGGGLLRGIAGVGPALVFLSGTDHSGECDTWISLYQCSTQYMISTVWYDNISL